MATIEAYETKKGKRYRVRYTKPDRKPTDQRGFKTKRDAQIFPNTVEVSKLEGTYIDPTQGKVTVGALAEPWRERQSHLKITTSTGLEQALRIHVLPVWENVRVADVKRTAVADWVAAMSKTRSPPSCFGPTVPCSESWAMRCATDSSPSTLPPTSTTSRSDGELNIST